MATDSATAARERNSRFLLLVLRDDPGAIHLSLDSEGWADATNLLTRANRYGFELSREDLADVLDASGNHRFEWDRPGDRIRLPSQQFTPLRRLANSASRASSRQKGPRFLK